MIYSEYNALSFLMNLPLFKTNTMGYDSIKNDLILSEQPFFKINPMGV